MNINIKAHEDNNNNISIITTQLHAKTRNGE